MSNPRVVWGCLLAAGGMYELYALLNDQEGDTLSEVTREVFGTDSKRGRILFTAAYVGFSVWFVPHVAAKAVDVAEEAMSAPAPRVVRYARRVWWPTTRR